MPYKRSKSAVLIMIAMTATLYGDQQSAFESRKSIVREIPPLSDLKSKKTITRSLPPPPPLIVSPPKVAQQERVSEPIQPKYAFRTDRIDENLSLNHYIEKVLREGVSVSSGEFESRIEQLRRQLQQSRYDFVVTYQAYLSASQLPTGTEGMGTTMNARTGIQASKILYDGNRRYFLDESSNLTERFSKYKKLSVREQTALYGADLYVRVLELQKRSAFIQKYQELDNVVYEMALQKYQRGISDNAYNEINAKMDKIALEKLAAGLQYDLHNATVAFKQAADIASEHDIALEWPTLEMPAEPVEILQQKALENNYQIGYADTLFRMKKGEVVSEMGRNDWQVDFNAFAGVGYSNTETSLSNSTAQGINWIVSLQAAYPLNPVVTELETERKMVEALKEKNNVILARQNMVQRINKLYTECLRENRMLKMMEVQKGLAERHLKITRYRLEGGLEPYSSYAASMKKIIEIEEDILSAQIRQVRNRFELQLLTGDLDR